MTTLRDLFHQPTDHQIGGLSFTVYKLQFSQFADALVVGRFLEGVDFGAEQEAAEQDLLAKLEQIAADSPERQALKRTLAGCLAVAVPGEEARRQLQADDIEVMPAPMLAEALAVVLEVNADFFFRTLPRLLQTALRIRSIGSALLKRLSEPGTDPTA